jgi:2-polyprenyl-3-methyl-5-hydroxy-6-metoxy-1,4-benzoquinol methylase
VETHLEYYMRHGLNPVRYEMANLSHHLQRRESLYRSLGLPRRTFRGARILEVAAGTGQNSLYLASLDPAELVLIEPNPVAQRDIAALYQDHLVRPKLIAEAFQNFASDGEFDIVICENWLGCRAEERALLRKLARLVAPEGILVLTAVSPVGILPNILRRALAGRLDDTRLTFAERTARLVSAFGPHLATLPAMTRSTTDWVQDNVLSPAYFGILLTIPMILEDLGGGFQVLGSSPHFATDWRWFKALFGDHRRYNSHFLELYRRNLHNFLDHRQVLENRDLGRNDQLDRAARAVIDAAESLERGAQRGALEHAVIALQDATSDLPAIAAALDEFLQLFQADNLTPNDVAEMKVFGSLFGRETLYVSLESQALATGVRSRGPTASAIR